MRILQKLIRIILVLIFLILLVFIISKLIKIVAKQYYKLENAEIIEMYSDEYNIDPYLVCAIIHTESKFNSKALSPKGASGYMQLMKQTADWGASDINIENYSYDRIFEPEINIQIGTWYLSKLFSQFKDDDVVIASYNGGSGNVTKWLQDSRYSKDNVSLHTIPFKETNDYVDRVNFAYKVYKSLYKGVF